MSDQRGRAAPSTIIQDTIAWPCPDCGAPTVPIVYGLPGAELFERAGRAELVLGGCTIEPGDPQRRCLACHWAGRRAEMAPDLESPLRTLTQPLEAGGWAWTGSEPDWGRDEGHSLFFFFERNGASIELEYYDSGDLVLWPTEGTSDDDDDIAGPIAVVSNADAASCLAMFRSQGWLSGPTT